MHNLAASIWAAIFDLPLECSHKAEEAFDV